MKKLINLIALVMLVSTNVLTPFSYAQVEVPEVTLENEVGNVVETGETPEYIEEFPENTQDNLGELEQENQNNETPEDILPNVQGGIETPVIDETENEGDEIVQSMEEISEVEVQDENLEGDEVEEDSSLQKVDEFITMEVIPNTSVTLLPGTGFNETIKRLAGGNGATYISGNSTITQIVQTGNIPEGVITGEISEPDSEYPVYAYFTGGILYYTTQAETIYMNPDSSYMFYYLQGLTGLDLNNRDTSHVINMKFMFGQSIRLEKLDMNSWNTTSVEDMSYMFSYCNNLKNLDINNWDVSSVTDMRAMFYDCSSLTGLDLSDWNVGKVVNMIQIFWWCRNLEYLDLSNWNTSSLTTMSNAFTDCRNLTYLNMSGWDFRSMNSMNNWINHLNLWNPLEKLDLTNAKFSGDLSNMFDSSKAKKIILDGVETKDVTNMSMMFYNCSNLTGLDLSSFDTSNVTNMENMFNSCSNLTGLDLSNFDTSKVTDMDYIFSWCPSLEELNLSGWDFRNVVVGFSSMAGSSPLKKLNMTNTKFSGSMSYAFRFLPKLEEIILDGVETKGVTNMSMMFYGCNSLTGLDLSSFDTSNVTDMGSMFNGCAGLTGLDLSNFDTSNVANMGFGNGGIFGGCNKLEELNLSGWDFKGVSNNQLMVSVMGGTPPQSLKNLNMTNTKFSGSMSYTFGGFSNLEEVNLSGADTRGVTNMSAMFYGDSNLTGLDLSNFDTRNVTNMGSMFYGCSKLESLNLDNWDLSGNPNMSSFISSTPSLKTLSMSGWKIPENFTHGLSRNRGGGGSPIEEIDVTNWNLSETKDVQGLFGDSGKLKTIKGLETWDTSNVTNMSQMFYGCSSLTGLDLSSFDTSSLQNYTAMFNGCTSLEILNLDGWDLRGITTITSSMNNQVLNATPKLKKLSAKGWKLPENFTHWISRYWGDSSIEEIDVSNWNLSQTKDIQGLFGDSKSLKIIKGLETWDTSSVTNMSGMFRQNSNLTGLDLSNWNTSNVTNMGSMFYNCSNLTGLDLSNFDTSNVTNMGGIFGGCNKLEEINLSGWDFRNYSNNAMMMNIMRGTPQSLKKLNMTNTKYTGSASYAFGGLTKLEELNLDGADTRGVTNMNAMFNGDSKLKYLDLSNFDTSNVTDMSAMFYNCSTLTGLNVRRFDTNKVTSMGAMFNGCSSLDELDLSNFDTSKVVTMGQMFFNTPNLKTIYASDKFVTTALSGDTSSKDMFSGTTSVVGGNGTKFDSNYIDKTYAKIDKVGQTGYFTDKNAINVKFINLLDGTETTSTFAKGQKLTPPYVDKYHVVGGYLDEEMTQAIDLNKGLDSYSVIYVKYDRNGSSGGGGGGGGSTKPDTPKEEQKPADTSEQIPQNNDSTSSGAIAKDPENDSSEQTTQNDESNIQDSPTSSQDDGKTYSTEFQEAYEFAKGNGITTMPTIQKANMEGKLTRIAMAKMLSQYAINVLGKTPDTSKTIKFRDVTSKKDADYDNGVTLAYQLGIMGQNMPGNNFRPNDEVTRAEFATALSRMAYNTSDGEYKSTSKYYTHHMEKLVNEGIITNDNPNMKELRGYVMIMLMRSAK